MAPWQAGDRPTITDYGEGRTPSAVIVARNREPDRRNWSKHSSMIVCGLLPTGEDEISVYFTQYCYSPAHCLQRGVFRTDGFVSLHAPGAGGEFTTKPLTFEGKDLVLNFSTSAAGSVRIEVQDEAGNAAPGFALADGPEIYGDAIEDVVAWKAGSDLSALAGKPVKLRFAMKAADLYAIRFR